VEKVDKETRGWAVFFIDHSSQSTDLKKKCRGQTNQATKNHSPINQLCEEDKVAGMMRKR